ncbi:POGZ [Lepeophtheirus salmonis]|uniref:POGZ n=1 Tax=Lepeophtheirus salmonis TaxID=72036 RepID=A0A7R8CZB3_LEPSM|nr:POGZ [Lepeophtheirus salmonis]CAF2974518.1 POGZ [Lepeophtheirus salmonis]
MSSTGTMKSSSSIALRPPLSCPLYMECDEEPLSSAQMFVSRERKNNLFSQLSYLEKLSKSASKVSFTKDDNVVIRVTEGQSTIPSPAPPPKGIISTTPFMGQQQPGYRLIMDPRTGRILGTIDSGGKSLQGPSPPPRSPNIRPMVQSIPIPPNKVVAPVQVPMMRQPAVVDLTRPAAPPEKSPSSKPFIPTLLVVPKPSKTLASYQLNSKRAELDSRVKALLIHSPSKFTEWLIQQGLIPSDQYEEDPVTGVKVKLKLGMYSDGKKFPSSGGYVWINESKANKCISVYSGSIFMASNHAPTVILKLIYHWSCQTNIQNVVQWFVRFAVHDGVIGLGGPSKTIQIGVISLGTTSAESSKREVKVEVLGVLDVECGIIRLRATEPALGVTQSERFARIFEPLPNWVLKNSWIITDFSVDKEQLNKLGYNNVIQCSVNSKRPESTNSIVMDFLKRTVPKMFQNNLSYLNTSQIQQFLDELTFREMYHFPLACFDGILKKVSQITTSLRSSSSDFVIHLQKIQDNPFYNWQLNPVAVPTTFESEKSPVPKVLSSGQKRAIDLNNEIDRQISKKIKVSSELVDLESYFYGSLPGDMKILLNEFKADMAFKCHLCREVYMNNIDFMKHLFLHVETERLTPVDLSDLNQCKYCCRDFETMNGLDSHMESYHFKKGL